MMSHSKVSKQTIASAVRQAIIDWLGRNTDLHSYEDYTEIIGADGKACAAEGSERIVVGRGSRYLTVRVSLRDSDLVLEHVHEDRSGWTRFKTEKLLLANPDCCQLAGKLILQWYRQQVREYHLR